MYGKSCNITKLNKAKIQLQITNYEIIKNKEFKKDYFLHLCYDINNSRENYIIFLPSLAIKIQDFEDFCRQPNDILKENVLNEEQIYQNVFKILISDTLLAVLYCSIYELNERIIFKLSVNRGFGRKAFVFFNHIIYYKYLLRCLLQLFI
ncbi:hypothetical protein COBT_002331 [Conglomerata obtusa]